MILSLNMQIDRDRRDNSAEPSEPWGMTEDPDAGVQKALPREILRDDFLQKNPELKDHFRLFMFMPIGIHDHIEITEASTR